MFKPNLTSELLARAVNKFIVKNHIESYLEIGSGSGFVTIEAFKRSKLK